MTDQFRLFPGDEEASAGDAVIQFLIDQQKAGNERAASVGNALSSAMEEVFPNFRGALENVTSGADERKQQLNDIFGLFGERPSVSEAALGFGVGSIGRVLPSILRGGQISRKPTAQIEGQKLVKPFLPGEGSRLAGRVAKTGQENVQKPFSDEVNIGGVRPPTAVLEARAVEAASTKAIQTRVKEVQKDLDRLSIAEANPLVPQSLVQEIAKKGLRAKAAYEAIENTIIISFKSKTAKIDVDDEFAILPTPDGLVLAVNFNSPTIKAELRSKFKEVFPTRFLADEIGEETQPGELQRMAGETSKDAPPPDNFSYFNLRDFEDGLQVINRMLDIAKKIEPTKKLSKKAQFKQRIDNLRKELGGGSLPDIIAKAKEGPKTTEKVNLLLKLLRKFENFDEN